MSARRGRPPHPEPITPAEARVLALIREGLPNAEIAMRLGLTVNTIKYHVSNLLAKSGTADRAELRRTHWDGNGRHTRLAWLPSLPLLFKFAAGAVAVAAAAVVLARFAPSASPTPEVSGIVFAVETEDDGGGTQLFAVDPSGRAQRAIGPLEPGSNGGMAWSRDGRELAYFLVAPLPPCEPAYADCPAPTLPAELRVLRASDGKVASRATALFLASSEPPAWDGSTVLVVVGERGSAVVGPAVRLLEQRVLHCGPPTFAGPLSACVRWPTAAAPAEVEVAQRDSAGAPIGAPFRFPTGNTVALALSPDGRWLARTDFADDRRIIGLSRLPLVGSAAPLGGEPETRDIGPGTDPVWSPDSRSIAYLRADSPGIWVFELDAGVARRITTGPAFAPTWSPDSKQLAFISEEDSAWEIYVVAADGSTMRRLTYNTVAETGIAWSPR